MKRADRWLEDELVDRILGRKSTIVNDQPVASGPQHAEDAVKSVVDEINSDSRNQQGQEADPVMRGNAADPVMRGNAADPVMRGNAADDDVSVVNPALARVGADLKDDITPPTRPMGDRDQRPASAQRPARDQATANTAPVNPLTVRNIRKRLNNLTIPESGKTWYDYLQGITAGDANNYIKNLLASNKGDEETTYNELVSHIKEQLGKNDFSTKPDVAPEEEPQIWPTTSKQDPQVEPAATAPEQTPVPGAQPEEDDEDDEDDGDEFDIPDELMNDMGVQRIIMANSHMSPGSVAKKIRQQVGANVDAYTVKAMMRRLGIDVKVDSRTKNAVTKLILANPKMSPEKLARRAKKMGFDIPEDDIQDMMLDLHRQEKLSFEAHSFQGWMQRRVNG